MKVLVIGGGGMLGHKLVQRWQNKFDVWTTIRSKVENYKRFGVYQPQKTFENINIEDIETIEKTIGKIQPSVIVNAVGVVKQLSASKDVIKTLTVNSIFPHQLSEIAQQCKARLITISTDCVFSGLRGNYTETDVSDARDLYGKSKYLGEITTDNCLTIRTSIIGRELLTAHSLVEWFLSNRGKSVKGFVNAVFSGFPTIVLADVISDLIENHKHMEGLYHVSSEPINKYDLLKLIKKAYQIEVNIERFEEFEINRSLDSSKFQQAIGFKPPGWKKMINLMANDNSIYGN